MLSKRKVYLRKEEAQDKDKDHNNNNKHVHTKQTLAALYFSFSVSWVGEVLPPVSGLFAFGISADDFFYFFLEGELMAEGWDSNPEVPLSLNPPTLSPPHAEGQISLPTFIN